MVGTTGVEIFVVGGDNGRLQAARDATKIEITKIRIVFKVASNFRNKNKPEFMYNSAG